MVQNQPEMHEFCQNLYRFCPSSSTTRARVEIGRRLNFECIGCVHDQAELEHHSDSVKVHFHLHSVYSGSGKTPAFSVLTYKSSSL